MILLIDNYDSFSYNLYQLIGAIEPDIKVIRNDELTVEQIKALNPERIVLSPGPGKPESAGVIVEAVQRLGKDIPVLGVCLGHQAICLAYGGKVGYAKRLMHGKQSVVRLDTNSALFKGLDEKCTVARYHSLIALNDAVPSCLKVTALTEEDEIMAVEHVEYPVFGVQFHPESVMTECGKAMLKNFIDFKR